MMETWRLPAPFVESVGGMAEPRKAGDSGVDAALLNVAASLTHAVAAGVEAAEVSCCVDEPVWRLAGVSTADVD